MKTLFLGKKYLALSLIGAKEHFFHESFITKSELNQFEFFIQQEFNNRNLDVVITSNTISSIDFREIGDVIITSSECCLNLNILPTSVLSILCDYDLIADFFMQLENGKLKVLKRKKDVVL